VITEDILGISDRGVPQRPEESCARGARGRAQNFLRLPQVFKKSEIRRPLEVISIVPVIKVGKCRNTCTCKNCIFVLFLVDPDLGFLQAFSLFLISDQPGFKLFMTKSKKPR